MKAGNLIRCADPPEGLSDETLGVVVSFNSSEVVVKWPDGRIKSHARGCILWTEGT